MSEGKGRAEYVPPMRNIRNRTLIPNQIPRSRLLKMRIQHSIQPPRLIHITINSIFDPLWSVPAEMVCLALHPISVSISPLHHSSTKDNSRANPSIQKEQPIVHLIVLPRAPRKTDLIILIILIHQILLDTAALKQPYSLAITERIRQSWDSPIGVDFKEPWLFLYVFADIDFMDGVGEPEFFECDRDFYPVGGLGCVEMDVWAR